MSYARDKLKIKEDEKLICRKWLETDKDRIFVIWERGVTASRIPILSKFTFESFENVYLPVMCYTKQEEVNPFTQRISYYDSASRKVIQ
jgi:hypothetical protein